MEYAKEPCFEHDCEVDIIIPEAATKGYFLTSQDSRNDLEEEVSSEPDCEGIRLLEACAEDDNPVRKT